MSICWSNSRARLASWRNRLAFQAGTILRDIDYLNFTLNGKARIFASGSAGYQLEIFERRSFFQLLQKHDNDDRLLALLLLKHFHSPVRNSPRRLICQKRG